MFIFAPLFKPYTCLFFNFFHSLNMISITTRLKCWPRKVFKVVQNHVLGLHRKWNFGPHFFSLKWTKSAISNSFKVNQSCYFTCDQKFTGRIVTLVYFLIERIYNFGPFRREIYDHVWNCNFGPFSNCSILQLWSISKNKRWTKVAFRNNSNTWFWTPSNTFLDQNLRSAVHDYVK